MNTLYRVICILQRIIFFISCFGNLTNGFKPEEVIRRGPGSDPKCMSPLVGSSEEFPNSAFSASSVWHNKTDFQPYQARLVDVYGSKEHTSGYAWCPNMNVDERLREWIQVDFPNLVLIKSIFTAGRGDGNVKEFMPSFVLKYQRDVEGTWYEHVKNDGTRILQANSDPRNLARATLDSVIVAKRIRIYPFSRKRSHKVCLRFALYGCHFPDGVISYSMPQGGMRTVNKPSSSYHQTSTQPKLDWALIEQLKDSSYDGQITGMNQLTGGMGQLMDNVAYLGNLTHESNWYPSQPGFHFVGWHQAPQSSVTITFTFDTIRSFTWIRLFTFDSIPLKVRFFSHATIAFSRDGKIFDQVVESPTGRVHSYQTPVNRLSAADQSIDQDDHRLTPRLYIAPGYDGALVVELALGHRIGRYLRLSLKLTDEWLVLSEIQFNSTLVDKDLLNSTTSHSTPMPPYVVVRKDGNEPSLELKEDLSQNRANRTATPLNEMKEGSSTQKSASIIGLTKARFHIFIGIAVALGLCLLILAVLCVLKCPQTKCKQKTARNYPTTPNILCDTETNNLLRSLPQKPQNSSNFNGLIHQDGRYHLSNGTNVPPCCEVGKLANPSANLTDTTLFQPLRYQSMMPGNILQCSHSSSHSSATDRLPTLPVVSTLNQSVPINTEGSDTYAGSIRNYPYREYESASVFNSTPSSPSETPHKAIEPSTHQIPTGIASAFTSQAAFTFYPEVAAAGLSTMNGTSTLRPDVTQSHLAPDSVARMMTQIHSPSHNLFLPPHLPLNGMRPDALDYTLYRQSALIGYPFNTCRPMADQVQIPFHHIQQQQQTMEGNTTTTNNQDARLAQTSLANEVDFRQQGLTVDQANGVLPLNPCLYTQPLYLPGLDASQLTTQPCQMIPRITTLLNPHTHHQQQILVPLNDKKMHNHHSLVSNRMTFHRSSIVGLPTDPNGNQIIIGHTNRDGDSLGTIYSVCP